MQVPGQLEAVLPRVDDHHRVPVPDQRGVPVAHAELDVGCPVIGQGDQRDQQHRRAGQPRQRTPPARQRGQVHDSQQHQAPARQGQQVRLLRPQGDGVQPAQETHRARQRRGDQRGGPARHSRQRGDGQQQHGQPVQEHHPRRHGEGDHVQRKAQQRQLPKPVQFRREQADLRAQGGAACLPKLPPPAVGRIQQAAQGGRNQRQPQHRAVGQLEAGPGELAGVHQQHEHHGGAQQVQCAPLAAPHLSVRMEHKQQRGPHHRRMHARQQTIGCHQQGDANGPHFQGDPQPPQQPPRHARQHPHVEAGDAQHMGDAQPGEGRPVLRGHQGLHAQ